MCDIHKGVQQFHLVNFQHTAPHQIHLWGKHQVVGGGWAFFVWEYSLALNTREKLYLYRKSTINVFVFIHWLISHKIRMTEH